MENGDKCHLLRYSCKTYNEAGKGCWKTQRKLFHLFAKLGFDCEKKERKLPGTLRRKKEMAYIIVYIMNDGVILYKHY